MKTPTILKEDQDEQGRWLVVIIVFIYALVGLAVKHWPLGPPAPEAGPSYHDLSPTDGD